MIWSNRRWFQWEGNWFSNPSRMNKFYTIVARHQCLWIQCSIQMKLRNRIIMSEVYGRGRSKRSRNNPKNSSKECGKNKYMKNLKCGVKLPEIIREFSEYLVEFIGTLLSKDSDSIEKLYSRSLFMKDKFLTKPRSIDLVPWLVDWMKVDVQKNPFIMLLHKFLKERIDCLQSFVVY